MGSFKLTTASLKMAVMTTPTSTLFSPKFKQKPFNFTFKSNHLLRRNSFKTYNTRNFSSIPPTTPLNSLNHTKKSRFDTFPISIPSLTPIKPFVQTEWKQILKGWICSVISVYCLSKIVPRVGNLSTVLSTINGSRLMEEGLVLGSLVLVRLVANYWKQAFLWDAALNSSYKIRVYVFEKVLQRDIGFFEGGDGVSAGDIAYRITAEASDVADTVYALLNTMVPSMLQLAAMSTQMVVVSPILSLISALAIPCMSLVIAYLGERLRKISKNAHLSVAKLSAYLNEVLPSMLFVKASSAELCESARFQRLACADLSATLKKKRMKAFIPQIIQVIYVVMLLIFSGGALVVTRGSLDGSSLISFITSLFLLIEPIQDVGKAYNELKQGEPAIERLFDLTTFNSQCLGLYEPLPFLPAIFSEFISKAHEVIERPDTVDLNSVTGDLKFLDVSFRYRENMPLVLNGLNLHIKPGETVALVGSSGGGKTTLMKLLLRLYDPICGCILIDNHNIQSIHVRSLRRHVGLVSQDITLFSGTVAENIGYRDILSKIDMERVEHAAKTANADEFIRTLSAGYETNIGQRGSILSGGQKQRLAIARAIYQNSSILILDEATSALDSKSELLVRQALERLMENHTVLVIAHRLETVLMADRVLLLENGKLEEVTRESLLNKDSHYDSLTSSGIVI